MDKHLLELKFIVSRGLSRVAAIALPLLCSASLYADECQQRLAEAKALADSKNYESCINVLKDSDCKTKEYYSLLLSAYYEKEDYSYIRQYTEELLKSELDNDSRAVVLHYSAVALYQQKQFQNALDRAVSAKEKWTDKESIEYAMTCNLLGNVRESMNNYTDAVSAYNDALDICKNLPDNKDKYKLHITTLNNMAAVYLHQGKKTAGTYIKLAMQVYNSHPEETVVEYLSLLNNVGTHYMQKKEYVTAVDYYKKSAEIKKEKLGEKHPSYALSLLNVAVACYNAEMYADAMPYIEEYIKILRYDLQRNFAVLTEQEREKYWNTQSEILDKLLVTATYGSLSSKSGDASLLYDICLLSKSLLLDTSVQIDNIISSSGNSKLKKLREELREGQKKLSSIDEGNSASAKKMISYCDSLERIVVQELGGLKERMQQIEINWKDVRSRIGDDDIAVEFICLGSSEKDKEYAVVMLRKSWNAPKVVYINGLAQTLAAKQISRLEMHDNSIFGRLVWQTVCSEVKQGGRIWFVPDSELHLMGIEFLTIENGKRMCDVYEMHRLTSTKQLVYEKEEFEWNAVALLGGMDYNASREELNFYADEYGFRYTNFNTAGKRGERLWPSLPGTLMEVQQINDFLKAENKQTFFATRDAATVSAFYNMSGKSYDIIHIATHGFYNVTNGNAMINSGLVMSGANTLRLNQDKQLGNGIITAKEISKLDFSKTKFVILSACQTGIGEVSTEGVFGLQRAFKMAGVDCILATLWEVDDAVAKVMMTSLYHSLSKDKDIYKAYNSAINKVKNSEFTIKGESVSGDRIELWGAFVLIDR